MNTDIPKPCIILKKGGVISIVLQDGKNDKPALCLGEFTWKLPEMITVQLSMLGNETAAEALTETASAMRQLQVVLASNLNRFLLPEWREESKRVSGVISHELESLGNITTSTCWGIDKSGH